MRQVTGLTSTYSSDVFGVCSALYELGGMVVMHDASGCNSTYTTHDEPRWYDMDSMIYVSAISEMEAILGNDEKWITDLSETALELQPKFIALVLAPIPYMIGTDVAAIAEIVSDRTGIPCFAFRANGMHDYTAGVSKALEEIVRFYARERDADGRTADVSEGIRQEGSPVVNLLGVTPLDFSVNGSVEAMRRWITDQGMRNGTCLAMDCALADVAKIPNAQVNLVVSSGGLAAAKLLRERSGMPYVVGTPIGERFSSRLADVVREAALTQKSGIVYKDAETDHGEAPFAIIGENVTSASLAEALRMECGIRARVLCPLDSEPELLCPGDVKTPEEDDLIREIGKADAVIADPLYRPLIGRQDFYPLPHTAFSGRICEKDMPELIAVTLKKIT